MSEKRFIPVKRTALDRRVWWVVFDTKTKKYSDLLYYGKYMTRKACQFAIDYNAKPARPAPMV